MLEKVIKKEPKEEEEEEEEEEEGETDEEEEKEEEEEGEGAGSKGLDVEEEWKLQHTEEKAKEPMEKLGNLLAVVVHLWLVVYIVTHYTYVYICTQAGMIEWLAVALSNGT